MSTRSRTQSEKGVGRRRRGLLPRGSGPYLTMLPALLFLVALSVFPLIYSLIVSFFQWNLMNPDRRPFVGLRNFQLILTSPEFWNSLWVTMLFVLMAVSVEFVLGLGLALLLSRDLPGMRLFRSMMIVPLVMAPIVVGLLWRFMLNRDYGVINYFVSLLGMERIDFLSSTRLALPVIAMVDIWQWTPFMFLILLAGIQALPREPFEAAAIDGASAWATFRHITLPLLRYSIMVALLLRAIDAFRVYDLIFMMTRGGPIDATDTLSWSVYNVGFRAFRMSYAAALSWIMLIMISILATMFVRLMTRRDAAMT